MQMINSDIDPTWDSVSSSIWLALFGILKSTVESAVFGAEFVVMKQAMEVS